MKTILITGSTDGIGKIAALKLAKDGHNVFLHGRNSEKLQKVINEIKTESNNPNIKGFVADFSDLKDVKIMATQVQNEIKRIDVLINNAGIFKSPVSITKDGFDIRFAVNYFAPYILTHELLPLLTHAKSPRVINLSSAAQDEINYDIFSGEFAQDQDRNTYGQSKLAILMWSFYFAKKHKDILTIALNPGSLLNTKMVAEAYGKFWSSADKGANIIYDLAVSNTYTLADSGKYFDNDQGEIKGRFNEAHPNAYNENLVNGLIEETNKILG